MKIAVFFILAIATITFTLSALLILLKTNVLIAVKLIITPAIVKSHLYSQKNNKLFGKKITFKGIMFNDNFSFSERFKSVIKFGALKIKHFFKGKTYIHFIKAEDNKDKASLINRFINVNDNNFRFIFEK